MGHAERQHIRYDGIDIARGAAMLFVCLSHFGLTLQAHPATRLLGEAVVLVGMIASPTFMMISGAVPALLHETQPFRSRALRHKLADRALFLIVVVHPLLMLADSRIWPHGVHWVTFITDVLAIALLFGPWMVARFTPLTRALVAIALYVATWTISLLWQPSAWMLLVAKNYMIGTTEDVGLPYRAFFPVLAWLAIYLLGGVLGTLVGRRIVRGEIRGASEALQRAGLLAVGTVLVVKAGLVGARLLGHTSATLAGPLYPLVNPFHKRPPGLLYLLLFGGLGLILVARAMMLEGRPWATRLVTALRDTGRSSLFAFVAQAFLYRLIVPALDEATQARWPSILPVLWPALFLATLLLVLRGARWWTAVDGNRWLGLGLARILDARAADRARHAVPETPPLAPVAVPTFASQPRGAEQIA